MITVPIARGQGVRRFAVATLVGSASVLTMLGCTATQTPSSSEGFSPSTTATSAAADALTEADREAIAVWQSWKRESAIQACMTRHGFEWTPEPYSSDPEFDGFLTEMGIDGEAWREAAEQHHNDALEANTAYRDSLDDPTLNEYLLARWGISLESWRNEGGDIEYVDNCDDIAWTDVGSIGADEDQRPEYYLTLMPSIRSEVEFIEYLRGMVASEP